MAVQAALKVLAASGTGQDRALSVPTPSGYLLAVADGTGGTGGGADAAKRLIALVAQRAPEAASTNWFDALCAIDDELSSAGGQTTAVVAFVDGSRVVGASVGDSAAWLISPARKVTDLTERYCKSRAA